MTDRECICVHDLIWHGTQGRCNYRDAMSFQCNCQAFRRIVPGVIEGINEVDMAGALHTIAMLLRDIRDLLGSTSEGDR